MTCGRRRAIRRKKKKRQQGGTIRPLSIVLFLGSSTIMPGAYLNRKKKKKQKGRGLLMGPILKVVGPTYKIAKFFGQKLINKKKK